MPFDSTKRTHRSNDRGHMTRIHLLAIVAFVATATLAEAGYTRPPYVDGCQSMGGRYVMTAA